MARRDLSTIWLYRYRFVLGYGLIGIVLAALLVFAGLYVPGGLSTSEQATLVKTAAISWGDWGSFAITNLPYHLLQAGILEVFGVSDFTIKLPSLILGLASALGLIFLLRRWFPPNIAVLASLIAVTTGQYLLIAQSGTGAVLYIFWPIMLLLLGTHVTRTNRVRFLWKLLFAATAALSLYSPLSFYTLLAITITVVLHPHLRLTIRRLRKSRLVLCLLLALATVAPLIFLLLQRPLLGMELLGLPTEWPNWIENLQLLATQYFVFWQPNATSVLTPVFGLGSALLIILGLYRLIRTSDATRSYLTISWLVCLTPLLIISPQYVSIIFVPAVLLLAAGLTSLIGYWYRLFPLNPYARIAGLLPIAVLVVALIGSGVDRFVSGYHYSPSIASNFSKDLQLLPKDTSALVVAEDERAFFEAVAHYRPDLHVTQKQPTEGSFTATRMARTTVDTTSVQITHIITTPFRDDSARFYIYEARPTQ